MCALATIDAPLIALEIHDASMWEPSRVLPIIDTMERWGYTALVLHQNDLLDACTQLSLTANYGVSDLRLKKVRNNAAWLNRLVGRLDRFDAKLFLEIKEPSFHDYALELVPDLLGAMGQPDPTKPAWIDFCRAKAQDLLDRVPGLGGLIITLASPEARVSLAEHMAGDIPVEAAQWFDDMIGAFQGPLGATGKALYVRDFSYTTDLQSDVLAAVDRCQGKVGASVKITAHDYFPEFPRNPGASLTQSPLILEFEAFGEHTGWGVIPNCRVTEFQRRMQGYRDLGAVGMLVRISWEAITGATALDSLSAVNVFALPRLINTDIDAKELVLDWLNQTYTGDPNTLNKAADLLLQSWQIPAASYWNTEVFPRHSCLPSSWQEGLLSMVTSGMGNRDQGLALLPDDPRLNDAARDALFTAKENATALAETLAEQARSLTPKLPSELAHLFRAFDWLPPFARQFELATKAACLAARARADEQEQLMHLRNDMLDLADTAAAELAHHSDLPHHHHVLLDPQQIRRFAESLPQTFS